MTQIQNVILAGSGRVTRNGWDVPAERPEVHPEVQRNLNARNNPRNEQDEDHQNGDSFSHNVHDTFQKLFRINMYPLQNAGTSFRRTSILTT